MAADIDWTTIAFGQILDRCDRPQGKPSKSAARSPVMGKIEPRLAYGCLTVRSAE
jgi:hypothetical protein